VTDEARFADWLVVGGLLSLVHTADTDKTRLSCLVYAGGVNTTADFW